MTASEPSPVSDGSAELPVPPLMPSAPLDETKALTRVCFGSCYAPQFKQSHVWQHILALKPDAFLYLGDNVYQRDENGRPELLELREAYSLLAAEADFAALRAATPVLPVWDDHDYGMNNAGADFPARLQTEALFKQVWAVPLDDPRRHREGVYYSRTVGPTGKRTQLILLDLHYFLTKKSLLGEIQWRWLEQTFAESADLRIFASPIPVLCDADRLDGWHKYPAERERLFKLIDQTNGVVIVSGDSHVGAHYRRSEGVAYPLLELTASSLNFPWREDLHIPPGPPDSARIGPVFWESNFGAVDIDWDKGEISLALYDDIGRLVHKERIALAALQGR
ncbi:MAG: alkaline phosphatase D family protein [Hyphomonadaceae bacterium]|nr:alkaline phosphatase D family protein [Hyphomonadaceae bacterium]